MAGAQVLHAKHSAARSLSYACTSVCVCVCVYEREGVPCTCVLVAGGGRVESEGHRGSICSLLLLCTDIRLR